VTFSAFAAYVVASGKVSKQSILPLAGIFFLACGASALNQFEEREVDAKMDRTKNRPIPSGLLSPRNALLVALLLLTFGFGILICGNFWICVILGALNILWYNGCYTWLKKKTAFAVVPGALSGVIPVFMGWSAGGGSLLDPSGILLALFLFIWQIPHFWLLMMKNGDEYHVAGYPVMTDIFSSNQVRNIIFAWMIGATGTSLLLVRSGFWIFVPSMMVVICMNLIILGLFFYQFYFAKTPNYRHMFISTNIFLIVVLSSMVLERFIF
jgi:protoheme IX farnesyltransferase